jgi:hypothetical protein
MVFCSEAGAVTVAANAADGVFLDYIIKHD